MNRVVVSRFRAIGNTKKISHILMSDVNQLDRTFVWTLIFGSLYVSYRIVSLETLSTAHEWILLQISCWIQFLLPETVSMLLDTPNHNSSRSWCAAPTLLLLCVAELMEDLWKRRLSMLSTVEIRKCCNFNFVSLTNNSINKQPSYPT